MLTKVKVFLLTLAITAFMSVAAFADPIGIAPFSSTDAMSTGLTAMSSEIMGMIATVLPVAMGIIAAVTAIFFGVRFIRSLIR